MRFPFRALPAAGGGDAAPRPFVDVQLEGIGAVPLAGLVDTGALRTRFAARFARIAGIDLAGAPVERVAVGGVVVEAACARVTLGLGDHRWDAPVWFCDPWPFPFQLLGLDGFLRHVRLTMSAYEEWVECCPEPAS